jgi:hypothetical protein
MVVVVVVVVVVGPAPDYARSAAAVRRRRLTPFTRRLFLPLPRGYPALIGNGAQRQR